MKEQELLQNFMRKAEGQAKDVESFQARMDDAREEAQKAIENMYNAEREAERARLEVAAATATLDAVQKTKDVEDYAQDQAKEAKRQAKLERKEARKKARELKRALQDSLFGSGPKSFLTLASGQPVIVERTLKDHTAGVNYTFGLGRRNMFTFNGKEIDIGLEVNWYDFASDSIGKNFQPFSSFFFGLIIPRLGWRWIPSPLAPGL
jgi:Membrane-fusion protein